MKIERSVKSFSLISPSAHAKNPKNFTIYYYTIAISDTGFSIPVIPVPAFTWDTILRLCFEEAGKALNCVKFVSFAAIEDSLAPFSRNNGPIVYLIFQAFHHFLVRK